MSEQQYLSVVQNMRLPVYFPCASPAASKCSDHITILLCTSMEVSCCRYMHTHVSGSCLLLSRTGICHSLLHSLSIRLQIAQGS